MHAPSSAVHTAPRTCCASSVHYVTPGRPSVVRSRRLRLAVRAGSRRRSPRAPGTLSSSCCSAASSSNSSQLFACAALYPRACGTLAVRLRRRVVRHDRPDLWPPHLTSAVVRISATSPPRPAHPAPRRAGSAGSDYLPLPSPFPKSVSRHLTGATYPFHSLKCKSCAQRRSYLVPPLALAVPSASPIPRHRPPLGDLGAKPPPDADRPESEPSHHRSTTARSLRTCSSSRRFPATRGQQHQGCGERHQRGCNEQGRAARVPPPIASSSTDQSLSFAHFSLSADTSPTPPRASPGFPVSKLPSTANGVTRGGSAFHAKRNSRFSS